MQGLILLDKPSGITSFKAVATVRRLTGERRVGHTGTLDPMATGVLPVLIGRATALSSFLLDGDKEYTAVIRTGIKTDTDDITGTVIRQSDKTVSYEDMRAAVEKFTGVIEQRVPVYSAVKQNGVRLYDKARKGDTVEPPLRTVTVYSAELSDRPCENEFEVKFSVSKGTYIRSLARDIGDYLGCGAALSSLSRTRASGFSLTDCTRLSDINNENIGEFLRSEEEAVSHFKCVYVTEKQAIRFSNGGALGLERLKLTSPVQSEIFRVKCGESFLGLGEISLSSCELKVKCVINFFKAGS